MPADSLLTQCQLAVRTGRFAKGDALLPAVTGKQAYAVVQSEGAGQNRAKKLRDKCSYYNVPLVILPALRFNAISEKVASAMAVTDPGFADRIVKGALQEGLPVYNADGQESA